MKTVSGVLTCQQDVYWYRNTGEKGKPVFQAPVILVPKGGFPRIERRRGQPRQFPDEPGMSNSICAVDFNGDGLLDLLLGTSWIEKVESPELTEEQQAAKKDLDARWRKLDRVARDLSDPPGDESREARIQRQKQYLKAWREAESARIAARKFNGHGASSYGGVWLFERTAAETAKP